MHIKSYRPAFIRVQGRLRQLEMDPFDPEVIHAFIEHSVPEDFLQLWKQNNQVDYTYETPGADRGRFRVNAFMQRGSPSMVFRHIKSNPPTFEMLNVQADILKKLCTYKDGVILVCGPTGVGKSSTLAAMLNHINSVFDKHIVTLEEPIEYSYTDIKSVFNQREVGIDTPSFALGLKSILRQDPDIILIGEMRDSVTFEAALSAAETGHLVFATLHASNVHLALERILDFFPPAKHHGIRRQIASSLRGLICQQLLTGRDGVTRFPVMEILCAESLAKKTILEGNLNKIDSVIEATTESGSKTFNQDLLRLVKEGKIHKEDAMRISPNPETLEMNLKGVFLSSGGIVE